MLVYCLTLSQLSVMILWHYARLQVSAEVEIRSPHFLDVMLCKYVDIYRRFGETDRFHFQGSSIPWRLSRNVGK
jgi:hypothetical protein